MSAPLANRAKRPLGSSCSSHARQFVAALQQSPEQLGRERVARHAHHSPGCADLLLHRHDKGGLELRVPLVDGVPPVLLRASRSPPSSLLPLLANASAASLL
jgi:hypothetical protein